MTWLTEVKFRWLSGHLFKNMFTRLSVHVYSTCQFIYLIVSCTGFAGGIVVLIISVSGHFVPQIYYCDRQFRHFKSCILRFHTLLSLVHRQLYVKNTESMSLLRRMETQWRRSAREYK